MLTVTNNLTTHLVIPRATGTGKALMLTPKGTVQVEASTGPLRDAERNGLVALHDSGGVREPKDDSVREAPVAGRTGRTDPEPEDRDVLLPQILALVSDGKSQREVAQALGVNRNVVQRAVRQARKDRERNKE